MLRAQAVAPVVFLGDLLNTCGQGTCTSWHSWPAHIADWPISRRGLVARHVAHLLDADHRGEAVAPGLELGGGGESGEAARGAGAFVARGRNAGEIRVRGGDEAAEVALVAEQLGREVADVGGFEVARLEVDRSQALFEHFAQSIGKLTATARPMGGEVRLIAPEHVNRGCHGPPPAETAVKAARPR